ncbi:hypothetical protein CGSHi22121_08843 [Haemophilus influenzae 22.1-21]|uniref:Uncharacterized protein n=1 Tax=Haemophilus influenzae (strain PittGG) TaxID=374931 RepID=A5UEP1_HAEIG|nr:hypothetical protein CGSHiGG_00735 [Haemophilus influenzae PittGG]EDJ88121.1 hypothetical protein CGSHi22121_08843 [Haemophilus influenzae 22.1-21]
MEELKEVIKTIYLDEHEFWIINFKLIG